MYLTNQNSLYFCVNQWLYMYVVKTTSAGNSGLQLLPSYRWSLWSTQLLMPPLRNVLIVYHHQVWNYCGDVAMVQLLDRVILVVCRLCWNNFFCTRFSHLLLIFNASVNFLIYCSLNNNFKSEMRKVCSKLYNKYKVGTKKFLHFFVFIFDFCKF